LHVEKVFVFLMWFYFKQAACETFCIGEDVNTAEADASLDTISSGWSPEKYRFTQDEGELKDACAST